MKLWLRPAQKIVVSSEQSRSVVNMLASQMACNVSQSGAMIDRQPDYGSVYKIDSMTLDNVLAYLTHSEGN